MLRCICLLVVSLASVLLLVAPVLADDVHSGTVLGVGKDKITIQDKNGDDEAFSVAADAKITLDGKPAKLSDIDIGDTAKVTVKKVDGKNVATAIEAKSKE